MTDEFDSILGGGDSYDLTGGDDDGSGLVFNLAGVDENKTDFPVIPAGTYNALVDSVIWKRSSKGNWMWEMRLQIADGDHAGRSLFHHVVFSENNMPRVKRTLIRLAPELDLSNLKPAAVAEEDILEGRACRIKVNIRPYQGQQRNNVQEILPAAQDSAFLGEM